MTFATAWRALVARGGLGLGDRCLVSGAAGGVAITDAALFVASSDGRCYALA